MRRPSLPAWSKTPGCPLSLLGPRRAVPSQPQTLHVVNVQSITSTRHPLYIHIKLLICSTHTHIKFMGHSVKLLCSSSAVRLCQWPAATVPLLSLLLSCSSEAQLELAVMGLSSSRSRGAGLSWRLLKQVLQTRLGSNSCWLGTGIFWSQQLAQNTLPQFLQGDTDGSLLDSQTEPLYTYSYHASPCTLFRSTRSAPGPVLHTWSTGLV